jgi:hypothetical protein
VNPPNRIPEGFTRDDLLSCVDREIRMREIVYRHRVTSRQMTEDAARREIETMRAVRAVIAQLPETPSAQASLFVQDRRVCEECGERLPTASLCNACGHLAALHAMGMR